jgi:hypothetical protein
METADLIIELMLTGANLYRQYQAAAAAGDQATLDQIHAQTVAASNALAPVGAPIVAVE